MESRDSLKLASLDGGGIWGMSQLEIMSNIMNRLNWDDAHNGPNERSAPYKHFDLIGGSGTGGLIAILFAKLQMSVEEASEEIWNVMEHVYNPANLSATQRTEALKRCIEDAMKRKGLPLDLRLATEKEEVCACFVVANSLAYVEGIIYLRTYPVPGKHSSTITVVDAVLATCAIQPYFATVRPISGTRAEEYIATRGIANPTYDVITEARLLFGEDAPVASLLSLGTGHSKTVDPRQDGDGNTLHRSLYDMMHANERRAQEIAFLIGVVGIYSRFSVNQDNLKAPMGHRDYLALVIQCTETYLLDSETESELETLRHNWTSQGVSITLAQLGEVIAVGQWFARHPRQTISLVNDIPYPARKIDFKPSYQLGSMPLVDPSSVLLYEIWIKCLLYVIQEVPTGPLELLTVSKSWYMLIVDSPLLWTNVFLENSEDEASRVWTFLYLSTDSPLHIHIRTILPSNHSLELLHPHRSRIKTISIMPGYHTKIPTLSMYWDQWKWSTSYILTNFFDELTPSELENSHAESFRGAHGEYFISSLQFTLRGSSLETVFPEEQSQNRVDEKTEGAGLIDIWERHIHSMIQRVLPTSFSMETRLSLMDHASTPSPSYRYSYELCRHVGLETHNTLIESGWDSSRGVAMYSASREAMRVLQRWDSGLGMAR